MIVAFLVFSLLMEALATTTLAANSSPGVSANNYVKYGWNGINAPPDYALFWEKTEVLSGSGNDVTYRTTGQMKNGLPTLDNGSTYFINLENGATNYTHDQLGYIIAPNLNQGDKIFPGAGYTYRVNASQPYSPYLTISLIRQVNVIVLESSSWGKDGFCNTTATYYYDKTSGMLLENDCQFTWHNSTSHPNPDEEFDLKVTETNIFSSQVNQNPINILYYVAAAAVIVPIGASAIILRRRKQSEAKPNVLKTGATDSLDSLAGVNPSECYLSDSFEHCVKIVCELHSRGTKALAVVREDPTFLTETCHLHPDDVILLSSKPIKGFKAINTLQEISIAIMKFVKAGSGVVLLDGLEYLISRFGFNAVYMCLQEKKIEFLEAGAILLIPLNMETLDSREKALLFSELKLLQQ